MPEFRFKPILKNFPLVHQGKTRDTFEAGEHLLIVATDRLSTHDVVHVNTIPFKGKVLTVLTVFWLIERLAHIPNHLVACGKKIYEFLPGNQDDYPPELHHRAIVVKKLSMIPVELIYRSYLAGSLYKKYYSKGLPNPYGIELPAGLPVMSPLSPPIFTPTDKSDTDDPLNSKETIQRYPAAHDICLQTFLNLQNVLRGKDIELIDSKFEVGVNADGVVCLADEIVTPDSSRFCDRSGLKLGQEPLWLDKQVARDEAEHVWGDRPKAPIVFRPEVVHNLIETYLEILWRITGHNLEAAQKTYLR